MEEKNRSGNWDEKIMKQNNNKLLCGWEVTAGHDPRDSSAIGRTQALEPDALCLYLSAAISLPGLWWLGKLLNPSVPQFPHF